MKSALFRSDGLGAAVGRLSIAQDRLRCDMGGVINEYKLIGNVVDTREYDVVVFGWLREGNTIEVIKMESIPSSEDPNVGFMWKNPTNDKDIITCLSIPNEKIVEVIQKHPENKKPYHSVKINLKKDTTLYLNITGGYEKPSGPAHVFLLHGEFSSEVKQYSTNSSKTIKTGIGQQLLS